MTLYEELKWRGLIKDVVGAEEKLQEVLDGSPLTFYWGTDPTAKSLHLGHYSSLCMARRLINAGHKAILLCGGATARIGDPRPSTERTLASEEEINKNIKSIKEQVLSIVLKDIAYSDTNTPNATDIDNKIEDISKDNSTDTARKASDKVRIVDNYEWTKDYTLLNFLRDIGKSVNVNYMINKDIIRRRLESGISFGEFTYMLLQGNDYLHLYRTYGCTMQVAGSDQWGNITTGVDLIRKLENKEVYAFTMPLVLDSSGKKFGKSEGNALWLDKSLTSPYEIYQYLLNTPDDKVLEYLKVLTFLSPFEIEDIYNKHIKTPEEHLAQKTLAYQVVSDIHGINEAANAVSISEKLFNNKFKELNVSDILIGLSGVPSFTFLPNKSLVDTLLLATAATSKREAREFISNGAVSINGDIIKDVNLILDPSFLIDSKVLVIRRGKKKYFIGKLAE